MDERRSKLTPDEIERYSRQMLVKEWMGDKGQLALMHSRVLVVGAGGSGSSLLYYLAAAGVGHISVCDGDSVRLSNLNRQILHTTDRLGVNKARSAYEALRLLNPCIDIEVCESNIDRKNISELAGRCDIICSAADDRNKGETYRVIEEYAFSEGIAVSWGGGYYMGGFLTMIEPGLSPCISCFMNHFEKSKDAIPKDMITISDDGAMHHDGPNPIVGAAAGIAGSMQAMEVMRYLIGEGNKLTGKLLMFQFRKGANFGIYDMSDIKRPECRLCGSNPNLKKYRS
jgi:adenylyltransferase/sulfurtransferase